MRSLRGVAAACAVICGVWLGGCGDSDGTDGVSGMGAPILCGGFTCAPGQTCVNNVCTTPTVPCTMDAECSGASCCAGMCISTAADRMNCGGCGVACAEDQVCTAGVCTGVMCNTPAPVPMDDGGVDDDGGVADSGPPGGTAGCPANERCVASGNAGVCQCGAGPSCPTSETCGATDSVCHCGAGAGCSAGSTCCGGTLCANLLSDAQNCGACGNACPIGQACSNGSCGCANSAETVCEDGCADLDEDDANCGACGNACPAEASCNNGRCVCPTPGEIGCGGECVPVNTDEHCGGCDGCPNAASGGASCQDLDGDGAFACGCASEDEDECGGVCRYINTNSNCGACGNACQAGKTSCQDTGDGTLDCLCPSYPNVQLCDDGGGGTACVNVQASDEDNCGGCGIACVAGDSCVAGRCDCSTGFPGEIYCDRGSSGDPEDYACSDPVDRRHCFDCDNTCPNDSSCNATDMDCRCTDNTESFCDGACTDTDVDEAHCGDCVTACTSTDQCDDGKCCPTSAPDNCNDTCVSTQTDENNCGTCGNVCGDSQTCCAGACRNLNTDNAHCGACGNMCPSTGCGFLSLFACACNGSGDCE